HRLPSSIRGARPAERARARAFELRFGTRAQLGIENETRDELTSELGAVRGSGARCSRRRLLADSDGRELAEQHLVEDAVAGVVGEQPAKTCVPQWAARQ